MTNDDAAALAAYRSDPVQARYQSWETPWIWFRRPRPCARRQAFETSLGRMRRADERIRQARGTPRHDRYRLETDMQATSATRKQPRP
jgi:hypothetical protein